MSSRISKNDSVEGVTTYTYDDNDRLKTEKLKKNGVVVQTIEYRYDDNGNLLSQLKNGVEEVSYTWDKENRLIGVRKANGEVISYQYDSDGIRVSSTVNGVKTEFLVDKNRDYAQVLEERVNNSLVAGYVYGNDLISQQRGSEKSFYLVDGLGSTRALTNQSGIVTDTYTYDAFGNLFGSTGSTTNNYRFAGEQFDRSLGDYYLRARYYDESVGRFTRRDSYEGRIEEPISLHKYLYTHADPVNFIDPTGLYKLEIRYRGFHSDIIITDKDSSRAYWASAENQDSSDYTSGIFNNISSDSSNSSFTGFGILVEHHTNSLRRPGFFEGGSRQVLLNTDSSTARFPRAIENKIQATLFRIEASRIRYNFLNRNSNSAAFQALQEALGYRPKPNVYVPAWNINPFTVRNRQTISGIQPFTEPFWVNPTSIYPLLWVF